MKNQSELKTVDIKGKSYVQVHERIMYFRENYPKYRMESILVSNEGGVCIFRADIRNENSEIVATGHAYEKENSTYINKTSYIENCETSAWGRALACMGIGIDSAIASAEEFGNAVKQQAKKKSEPANPQKTRAERFGEYLGERAKEQGCELSKAAEVMNGVITDLGCSDMCEELCEKEGVEFPIMASKQLYQARESMEWEVLWNSLSSFDLAESLKLHKQAYVAKGIDDAQKKKSK